MGLLDPLFVLKAVWWLLIFGGLSLISWAFKKYQLRYSASLYLIFLLLAGAALLLYYLYVFQVRILVGPIGLPIIVVTMMYLSVGVLGRIIADNLRQVPEPGAATSVATSPSVRITTTAKKISTYCSISALTVIIATLTVILAALSVLAPECAIYDTYGCSSQLARINTALHLYNYDNNGVFPSNLGDLSGYLDFHHPMPFVCPGSGKEYVLVIAGLSHDLPDYTVSVYCPQEHLLHRSENDYGPYRDEFGLNVFFLKGSDRSIPMDEAKKLFAEQGIEYHFKD